MPGRDGGEGSSVVQAVERRKFVPEGVGGPVLRTPTAINPFSAMVAHHMSWRGRRNREIGQVLTLLDQVS